MVKTMWVNRRYMAWLALIIGLILFPISFLIFPVLGTLVTPIYGLISTVMIMYQGSAVFDDKWKREASIKGKSQ